jgi:hypothetical protein
VNTWRDSVRTRTRVLTRGTLCTDNGRPVRGDRLQLQPHRPPPPSWRSAKWRVRCHGGLCVCVCRYARTGNKAIWPRVLITGRATCSPTVENKRAAIYHSPRDAGVRVTTQMLLVARIQTVAWYGCSNLAATNYIRHFQTFRAAVVANRTAWGSRRSDTSASSRMPQPFPYRSNTVMVTIVQR